VDGTVIPQCDVQRGAGIVQRHNDETCPRSWGPDQRQPLSRGGRKVAVAEKSVVTRSPPDGVPDVEIVARIRTDSV